MAKLTAKCTTASDKWIVDSSASAPMSLRRDWFQSYHTLQVPKAVQLGNKHPIPAIGIGAISLQIHLETGGFSPVTVNNVYHVPKLHGNLLSVARFTQNGGSVKFMGNTCKLTSANGLVTATAYKHEDIYILDAKVILPESALITVLDQSELNPDTALVVYRAKEKTSKADLTTWHRRLGHANMDAVRALFSKGLVLGGELIQSKGVELDVCKPCLEGKQTRSPIPKDSGISNPRVLFRIFSDVCGPMQTETYYGFRYYILHLDGNSHYLDLQLMKTKDESFRHARFFIERAEVVTGHRVNLYRSNSGREYGSHEFRNYLELKGIHHEITNAYTPQENRAAE